ncbi:MAG: type II secretion system protein [Sulfuricella sp.]|nr:type II secretion system protein [Sulfuricella sp.]
MASLSIRHGGKRGRPVRMDGFTYLAVMLFIAIMGVALAAVGTVWHTAQQQEKEQELLFIGNQFRRAINHYAMFAPSVAGRYPARLEDLLKDPRFPGIRRHLRKIYTDPITGRAEWGLFKNASGEIIGVYSLSEDVPLKKAHFSKADQNFESATKYTDWVFMAVSNNVPQGLTGGVIGGTNVRK